MALREKVRSELDNVGDEYLPCVYRLLRSLAPESRREESAESWREFVAKTYGSLADDPIERGEQGALEARLPLDEEG